MRRISSSRRFSRNTASPGVSSGRSRRPYFTLPSNSPSTPCSGQAMSAMPMTMPISLRTSNWSSGSGSPCVQHRNRDRVSPTDWAPGRINRIDTCRCWVCGQPSTRRYIAASSSGVARSRSIAPSKMTSARSTPTSDAVSTAARGGRCEQPVPQLPDVIGPPGTRVVDHIPAHSARTAVQPEDVHAVERHLPETHVVVDRRRTMRERNPVPVREQHRGAPEAVTLRQVGSRPDRGGDVRPLPNAVQHAGPDGPGQVTVLVAEGERLPPQEDAVVVQMSEFVHADEDPPRLRARTAISATSCGGVDSAPMPVYGNRARLALCAEVTCST